MYETKTVKEVLNELNVNPKQGLSDEEVTSRREKYGENKLAEEKKKSLLRIFFAQFNDPMIYILFAAAILSIAVSLYGKIANGDKFDFADPIIIFGVVVLNAIIGTVQESRAEKSLEALKKMSSPTCLVRRNGQHIEIRAEELVPGDIVVLEEGRTIPADLRLIETINFKANESSLTGESLPVEKDASFVFTGEVPIGDRINLAYMSTPVVYGRGEGVVIGTGMNTETGKIAKMLTQEEAEPTPLQKKLAQLSKFLGILTIAIVIVIFLIQLVDVLWIEKVAKDLVVGRLVENFMFAISLAVAAIPEGLPAVVTIVLALGVQKMVKANTIVRKLPSVETLGAVRVVCSDKTGTLTQNKMTVVKAYVNQKVYDANSLDSEDLHMISSGMSLCSNAEVDGGIFGDPTEIALVEFANRNGLHKADLEKSTPRIDEIPFDSVRKMMSTQHDINGEKIIYTKGAIDSILKVSTKYLVNGKEIPLTDKDKDEIMAASNQMSKDALRVLAFAYKKGDVLEETDLVFVGFVGMIDPPRPEAKNAVDLFKSAGITTIMITGDHKVTALAIASELGICKAGDEALSGEEIDKLTPEELQEKVKTVHVFARVSPENKVQIVKAIKANGNIAAMTGDGVNDAPSLTAADIGIAMGITGTDVAKGAADMVLTDDNFSSIEKAVEEGRGIYNNIRKTVIFLLGSNIAEVLVMFIIVMLSLFTHGVSFPTPLLAIHILWINLITDSLPAVALGADAKDLDIMQEQPRNPNESLFARGGSTLTFGYGAIISLATLFAFLYAPVFECGATGINNIAVALQDEAVCTRAQTMAFCVLGFSELFHMLGMTSIRKSFIHNFKNKNILLWVSLLLGIVLQICVVMIPGINTFFKCSQLDWKHWGLVFGLSLLPLLIHEIVALALYIKRKKESKLSK